MTGDMVVKRTKASNGARGGIVLSARACATKSPTEVRARGMYLHTVALIRPPVKRFDHFQAANHFGPFTHGFWTRSVSGGTRTVLGGRR